MGAAGRYNRWWKEGVRMNSESSRRNFLAAGLALPAAGLAKPTAAPLPAQASAQKAPEKVKLTYRTLGKTGLKVTSLSYGCMTASDPSVIERAADMGIIHFDSARSYQSGNNERMVGAALKGKRKQVILSSKSERKTGKEALAELDTSLREMGTDYLDIWYLHNKSAPAEVTDDLLEAQRSAKKAGKIRFAGVSTHYNMDQMLAYLAKLGQTDVVLTTYNFSMKNVAMDDQPARVADMTAAIQAARKGGGANFSVGARQSWYPSVNSFRDHALYHLVFKVPKQYTLVSVGKLDRQWTEQDLACSEWSSGVPLAVAGFNYGAFTRKDVTDPELPGFAIEGYAASEVPDYLKGVEGGASGVMTPARLIGQTLAETENAMRIYNAWFGKSAFSRIAITQQPEFNFGQSWPTLVYLPLSAYLDSTQRWQLMGLQSRFTEFIDEVTPHEVSHQWWGHMVGWSTFHDQWLSEGFATFSAGLYLQLTEKSPDKCLKYWESARQRILEKNAFGRRANDAGPVWMGLRLASMKNANGYSHVVYRKGAYVLHMLRQLMYDSKLGDKPFIDMMHDFVAHHMNGNASTESFQRVVEQHMSPLMDVAGNRKMDWFFSEWVYGTAVPRYKFDYTVTPAEDGKWLLKGRLTQSEVPANFVMQVPIYLDFGGQVVQLGRVKMAGNTTVDSLNVTLPKQPKRVLINYWHDVLEQ